MLMNTKVEEKTVAELRREAEYWKVAFDAAEKINTDLLRRIDALQARLRATGHHPRCPALVNYGGGSVRRRETPLPAACTCGLAPSSRYQPDSYHGALVAPHVPKVRRWGED